MKSGFYNIVRYAIIAVMSLSIAYLLYRGVGFYYLVNDDMVMQQLTSGYYTGTSDGHLARFIYYVYGNTIATFFKIAPEIDWYGGGLIGLNFFCYSLIVCRTFKMTQTISHKIATRLSGITAMVALFLEVTIMFQFTVVSGTLAATALFLFITARKDDSPFLYILIWILYLISTMLRVKMFFMVAPLFLIIAAYKMYEWWGEKLVLKETIKHRIISENDKRKIFTYVLITVAGITLYLACNIIEETAYKAGTWAEYTEYNHYRSLIMDYYGWPPYEGNEDFYTSIDVSKEEQGCLKMFGVLPDIDANKIKKIAEYSQSKYVDKTLIQKIFNMMELLRSTLKYSTCRIMYAFFAGLVIWLCCTMIKRKKVTRLFILAGIAVQTIVLLYMLYKGRLPDRIVIDYGFQCIFVMYGILLNDIYLRNHICLQKCKNGCYLVSFFIIILAGCEIASTIKSVDVYKEKMSIYKEITDYMTEHPNVVYISSAGSITAVKQFSIRDVKEHVNWFGSSGWSSKSPWYIVRYKDLGIDPYSNILLNEKVCFITDDLTHADSMNTYYLDKKLIDNNYTVTDKLKLTNGEKLYVVSW